MIESIDLAALTAVTGGRVTNDGADPALIDSVTGLGVAVHQVSSSLLETQQQFDQQMFPLMLQMLAARNAPPAAAEGEAAGGMLDGLL